MNNFDNLEKYTPKAIWDSMMFMGIGENRLSLYKHCDTRKYINISDDGKFYKFENNKYIEITEVEAMWRLLN